MVSTLSHRIALATWINSDKARSITTEQKITVGIDTSLLTKVLRTKAYEAQIIASRGANTITIVSPIVHALARRAGNEFWSSSRFASVFSIWGTEG
jgi:hypothetical protein